MRGVAGWSVTRYRVPGLARHVACHPRDIVSVARAAWRLRRRRWWRHSPWLPLPAPSYWEFRLLTANGERGHLDPAGVVAVAKWAVTQKVGG